MKLTKAQAELLRSASTGGWYVNETYSPAKKLVELGLCMWNTGRLGSTWLTLTEAGRKALEESR